MTTKLALFPSEKLIQTDLTTPSVLQGWVWRPKSLWPIWTSTTLWCWPGRSSTCITPLKAPCRGPHVTTCGTQVSPAHQRPLTALPLYTRLGVIYHLLFAFSTSSKAHENAILKKIHLFFLSNTHQHPVTSTSIPTLTCTSPTPAGPSSTTSPCPTTRWTSVTCESGRILAVYYTVTAGASWELIVFETTSLGLQLWDAPLYQTNSSAALAEKMLIIAVRGVPKGENRGN